MASYLKKYIEYHTLPMTIHPVFLTIHEKTGCQSVLKKR